MPLAPLLGYEADPEVLGAPFFVMGFVDGVVPIEAPMYTTEGFFTELAPEARTEMIDTGVQALAAVHSVDWRTAGLDWLATPGTAPTTAHQLDLWEHYGDRELAGRDHPGWSRGRDWLRRGSPRARRPRCAGGIRAPAT